MADAKRGGGGGGWEKSAKGKREGSLRKHPFLLALRETSPATKSEEKRMFSQAKGKGAPAIRAGVFSQLIR